MHMVLVERSVHFLILWLFQHDQAMGDFLDGVLGDSLIKS